RSPESTLSCRLSAERISETHLFMVKSARIVGEQRHLQIGLEGVCITAQDTFGTGGEGIKVPDDHFDGPFIPFDKAIASNLSKAVSPQPLLDGVRAAARYTRRGDAPGGDGVARPFVHDLGYNALPRSPVAGETGIPDDGQAVPRLQPSERLFRNDLLIEAVKR